MLYCDAATFCRRRNDAGIMTDETGRRCAQESIDIIIMKNNYNYLFIIKIILITYLLSGCLVVCMAQKKPKNTATAPTAFTVGYQQTAGKAGLSSQGKRHKKNGVTITGSFVSQY